jgi:hypothetical protein
MPKPGASLEDQFKPDLDVDDDEEQLPLIALEPVLPPIQVNGETGNRPRGRPKGSKNRRSSELARYILSRHRNPVEAAAEVVDAPLTELATVLSCTKLEAAEYWRKCAEFVARYTLQTMPQSLNLQTPLAGYLTVINMSAPKPGEDQEQLSPFGLDMKIVENQEDSEAQSAPSLAPDDKPLK